MKKNFVMLAVGTMLRISRGVIALLGARKGTRDFAKPMRAAHNKLKVAQAVFADAQDAAIDADAVVSAVHFDSQEFVTDFELALFTEVRKNRKSDRYQYFFATTMTAVKAKNATDFHGWLVDLQEKKLGKLPTTDPLRKKFEKPLADLLPQWVKPLADQHTCDLAEQDAARKLEQAKQGWSNAYIALHGALETAFPDRPAFVASFFKNGQKSSATTGQGGSGQKITEKTQAAKTAQPGNDGNSTEPK